MEASIKKNQTLPDDLIFVLERLVTELNLKVTFPSIKKVKNHPEYPSITALTDSLSEWNIENVVVSGTIENLLKINCPAIAHISKNYNHFVLIQKIENQTVHYADPLNGVVAEPVQEFAKYWQGILVLFETTDKSGEDNFYQRKALERFNRIRPYVVLVLLFILLSVPMLVIDKQYLTLYLLKIAGGVTCYFLLLKQFGKGFDDFFCKVGEWSDCDSVINSDTSTLAGIIRLSEVGALYFSGGLLSMIFSAYNPVGTVSLLFLLEIIALPFSLLSVYYQWRIARKWCPLCISVFAIIWLEFFVQLYIGGRHYTTTNSDGIVLGFSLITLFWVLLRKPILASLTINDIERKLDWFTKREDIFPYLLNKQPVIENRKFNHDIIIGSDTPNIHLLFVISPTCSECKEVYSIAVNLLDNFFDEVSITFRFALDSSAGEAIAYEMLSHLLALHINGSNQKTLKAMSDWYKNGSNGNVSKWKNDHPLAGALESKEAIHQILVEHDNWCRQAEIKETPVILINGKRIPKGFGIHDLKYHVRKFLE